MAEQMDDNELKSIVQAAINGSTSSLRGSDGAGDLANQRKTALEFYYAEKFGNEVDGQSQIVSHDVADVIEWLLPGLLEIFVSGDEVVRFEPQGPEDEDTAKQATEYVNWIFNKDNPGFQILFDMFKDALLLKTGQCKVYWEDTEEQKRETFTDLTMDEAALILEDDSIVEIIEATEKVVDTEIGPQQGYDITVLREVAQGRVKIETFPPDELLISRRAKNVEDSPFVGHRTQKTITELIEMGFDQEVVSELPSYDEAEFNEERLARFEADDEWPNDEAVPDESMRSVWITECYIRVDFDGDGIGELRQVIVAGPGNTILSNEAVDECPVCTITPIPIPHKFFGLSVADQIMDLQKIKSTVQRQMLDNMYQTNNARTAVSGKVDLDDLLTNRVGGVVRVDGSPGEHIMPLVTPSLGQHAFPLLEYIDQERESRTGVSRYNQGLDPDALNDTATGISLLQNASLKRQTLIARVFAEGVREIFAKVLRLIVKHQDKERMIRLRNEWIPMDPRHWNGSMDVSISVGLGHGSKDQQMFMYTQILNFQREIIELQQGLNGPLVGLEQVHSALEGFVESGGVKSAEPYFMDPAGREGQEQEQEQPDPAMIEAQMKMQLEQQRFQNDVRLEQAKMAQDQQQSQAEMAMKQEQAGADIALAREKAQNEYQLAVLRAQMENALAREKAGLEIEVSASKLVAEMEMSARDMEHKHANAERDHTHRAEQENKQETSKSDGNVTVVIPEEKKRRKKVTIQRENGEIVGAEID